MCTDITQGPIALICQALDVCKLVCNSGALKHEHLKVTSNTLLRLVEEAAGNICTMSQEEDQNRKLDMSEDCSIDLLNAIGLASLVVSALDSESFEPDGPDLHGLDAVHTLLTLCKSAVDNQSQHLMAEARTERPEDEQATYMAGVELARAMMDAADQLEPGEAEIEAKHRSGAQADFARPFLMAILQRPELLPGFSAVVSFVFGTDQTFHSQHIPKTYGDITGVTAKPKRNATSAKKAVAA